MSEALFCIKTFVLTIAIVIAMQIQVGERTIEDHALSWVQTSPVVRPLNGVARGAAKLAQDGWAHARSQAQRAKHEIVRRFQ